MDNIMDNINKIYCGDNLEIMRTFPDEFVDLIYLDPPFFSLKNYERNVKTSFGIKNTGFEDIYEGDINTYLHELKIRVLQMYRILKPTGSLYFHCDWHASHYIKVKVLDDIFKYNNFRNEIVWCYSGGGIPKKDYPRKHDTIFRYTKSDEYIFNIEYKPYKNGIVPTHSTGEKLDLERGTPVTDWWTDIKIVTPFSAKRDEKLGYPTQKPEALLERIIKASSNEGDVILDPYCGCGSTIAVAKKLKRKFIGIDILPQSCVVMADRIGYPISDIIGLPTTLEDLKKMTHFVFQQWVCDKMCAINTSKSKNKPSGGDGGIDGIITNSIREYMDSPIQVAQQENVGVNKIRNFYAAMSEKNKKFGFIIALSFGRGAVDKADEYRLEKGIDIKLIKAEDLCNIQHYDYDTQKISNVTTL